MNFSKGAGAGNAAVDGSRRQFSRGSRMALWPGAAVTMTGLAAAQPASMQMQRATKAVTPFRVTISSAAINDAQRRLQATRWPERETSDGWRQGVPLETIQALVAYWRSKY